MESTNQKQSISDDQELAKVLAGINSDAGDSSQSVTDENDTATLPTPATPMPGPVVSDGDQVAAVDSANTSIPTIPSTPQLTPEPTVIEPTIAPGPAPAVDNALEEVKRQALGELRPLVDKLNVDVDEKFDIYLLLLRSTDDRDLIAPAHEAAKAIPDESKRAQALLDVIKEIDFLSQNQGQ